MIRFAALLALLSLAWITAPAALADEEPKLQSPEIQELVDKARSGETLSDSERKLVLDSMWEWPAGRGPARDLLADDAECRKRTEQDPKLESAHPLEIFLHRAHCMEALGWVQQKKAEGERDREDEAKKSEKTDS